LIEKYSVYLKTFKKYSYLLSLLVKKDIKKKYKGSVLGIIWSFVNPLLNMIILSFVFSTLFKGTIDNLPVYILSGLLLFSFFSLSTTSGMTSIIASEHLIKKIYIPKYIITISTIISNFVFFLISLLVLLVVMLTSGTEITPYILYSPIYLGLLFVFCAGISLLLAAGTVFFRDIEHIYSILITALMYSSAIFYPSEIIPGKYKFLLDWNPVYHFIHGFRTVVYYGQPLDMQNLLICVVMACISLLIGVLVFERNQNKFIFHI